MVTIDDLPGYQIREIVGEVVGVTARPQNKFTEGARSLTGTLSAAGEQYLIAGRREAVERMAYHARNAGANAVVGMRFDHRVISESMGGDLRLRHGGGRGRDRWGTGAAPASPAAAGWTSPPPPEPGLYETTMTENGPS